MPSAEAWDAIAPGYASRAASFTAAFAPELLAAAHASSSSGGAAAESEGGGLAVLDVAAGSGAVALLAATSPTVGSVHACDLSPAMLEQLSAAAASLPGTAAPIEATACDATTLPMPSDTYARPKPLLPPFPFPALRSSVVQDAVASNFGVIFAPDVGAGLAEMARVCKPVKAPLDHLQTVSGPPTRSSPC